MITASHLGILNPAITVNLMGEFSCTKSAPVTFAARTAAEVVAYLALHKNRWVPREELAGVIWPMTDPKAARTNLRKAVQRVRESLGPQDVLLKHGDNLAINRLLVISDLDRAEVLHRQYAFAPHMPESIDKLYEEWQIIDQPLLAGWDVEWVLEERKSLAIRAHELGVRVLDALEATGKFDECLDVMQRMIHRSPLDYDLIHRAIRLQSRASSTHAASNMLDRMLADLPPLEEIPKPVRRLIQRVQQGQIEQVPAPELFETKNELSMLARMVESNLNAGNPEAMALLAKESSNVDNWSHAKTLLSILTIALENSDVKSDDEIQVAINACFLGSYASDFQVGNWAGQRVLEVLDESDERYIRTTSVLAFLHFETKNYDQSRELHDRALDLCRKYGVTRELPRVLNRKAVLEYHLGNFDVAHPLFLEAIELESQSNDPGSDSRLASFHGNLCTMEVLRFRWEAARKHGELTFQYAEKSAKIYQIYVSAALGLALYKLGEPKGINLIIEGIIQTTRERLRRFNMMSIDFGVALLTDKGSFDQAAQIASVNRQIREASGYPRGPAEVGFVKASFDFQPNRSVPRVQPMSLVALSRWTVEELEAHK